MSYLRLFHPKRHPCAILLVVQLLGMLLYPFIENTEAGHIGFNVFGIVVLGITTGMVRRTPGLAWISACIAGPVIVLLVLQMAFGMRAVAMVIGTGSTVLLLCGGQLDCLYDGGSPRHDGQIVCRGCHVHLAGWGFTHLFVLAQALQPGTFAAATHPADPRSWTQLNYLSFALLSSTGIGDVIPLTAHARALASMEMFVGLIYLAAVVARLIGFTVQANK